MTARHEGGQALILFVLAIAALLGFAALAIDVGQAMVDRRSTQNAVDAAALAGAAYLPNRDTAIQKVNQWLTLNGYTPGSGNTVTITTPYNGDANKIEVKLSNSVGPSFGNAVGFHGFNITSRSVGKRNANPYAIFQSGPGKCNGELELEGGSMTVHGDIYADGEFELEGGSGHVYGAATYACTYGHESGSVLFDSGPTFVQNSVPPPVTFQYSSFSPCTFSITGNLTISDSTPQYFVNNQPSSGQLKPGTYCATGNITFGTISAATVTGNVTFVSHGYVHLSKNLNVTAYSQNVLAFNDASGDDNGIEIEASSVTFTGMLLAPAGEIEVEGGSITSSGTLIMGREVELEGTFNITASNFGYGGPHLAE